MVNLNRQIGVSQARQGGFSSHVLPGPVSYAPGPSSWLFPPRKVDDNWVVDFSAGGTLQFADGESIGSPDFGQIWNPTWSLETAAGPYPDASWLESTVSGTRTFGQGSGGFRSISQVDARFAPARGPQFTIEGWMHNAVSGGTSVRSDLLVSLGAGAFNNAFKLALVARSGVFYTVEGRFSAVGIGTVGHDSFTAGQLAAWNHYAIVVDYPADEARIYFGGQLVADTYNGSFSLAGADAYNWAGVDRALITHAMDVGNTGAFSANAGVSGLRFTPSVLYTSNFTPPQL